MGNVGHNIDIYNVRYALHNLHTKSKVQQEHAEGSHFSKWNDIFKTAFGDYEEWPKVSSAMSDWEHRFNTLYHQNERCILFIVGPPGKKISLFPLHGLLIEQENELLVLKFVLFHFRYRKEF